MKKQIVLFVALLAAIIWMLPVAVMAQGVDAPDPFEDEESAEAPADEAPTVDEPGYEEEMAEAKDEGQETEAQLPLERRAKVVQKKVYPKTFKHELSLFFGINPADSFVISLVEGLRYSFHINEMFGVQVVGGYLQNFDKPDTALLIDSGDQGGLDIDSDFIKNAEIEWFVGADFVFYPVYGKFALMSDVIAHYDVGVYVGCAAMSLNNGKYSPAPDIGLVANIYFLKWLSMRADFMYYALITTDTRDLAGEAVGGTVGGTPQEGGNERGGTLLRNNFFITLGISFHLPVD